MDEETAMLIKWAVSFVLMLHVRVELTSSRCSHLHSLVGIRYSRFYWRIYVTACTFYYYIVDCISSYS